jgi:hypothetical protein
LAQQPDNVANCHEFAKNTSERRQPLVLRVVNQKGVRPQSDAGLLTLTANMLSNENWHCRQFSPREYR